MKKNPQMAAVLRGIVSAYLIYLGVSMLRNIKEANYNPLIIGFALLFIAFGGFYLYYSYRSYRQYEAQEDADVSAGTDQTEYSGDAEDSDITEFSVGTEDPGLPVLPDGSEDSVFTEHSESENIIDNTFGE